MTLPEEKSDLEKQILEAEALEETNAKNLKFLRAKLKLVIQHMGEMPKKENAMSKDKPETR